MRFWSAALDKGVEGRRWLPWGMLAVGALGVYIVGFDQGHLLAPLFGEAAFANNWLHELFHDARHIGAFMCH